MLPLSGRRVLVTRAREQASALGDALQRKGAEVLVVPAIEIAPPASYCGLDAALTTLRAYDWLLFTSANAVSAFALRARRLGLSPVARRVGVIGPATARAVLAEGVALEIDVQPRQFVAEALVEALGEQVRGRSVLLVRAAEARDVLVDGLQQAGAEVTVAAAYKTVVPGDSVRTLQDAFHSRDTKPDIATFTSGSSATNLASLLQTAGLELPAEMVLASIGPITSGAMRDLGWKVSLEASEATIGSLVTGLVTYFS